MIKYNVRRTLKMAEQQETKNPFESGPYIQMAAFCERVLREADGVLSLIRIVDQITHTEAGPNAPMTMPEIRYPLMLVITLKSGTARGRHEIGITPQLPSGETLSTLITTIQLEGENKGVNFTTRVDIPFKYEGLHWFNVTFDGIPLTRVPVEVRYARLVTGPPTQGRS